jgi:hypothetical protein
MNHLNRNYFYLLFVVTLGLVQLVKVQPLKTQLVNSFSDKTARMKLVNTKKDNCMNQE